MDGPSSSNLPPEVSAAIGRFRMGADDEHDRQVLVQYLVTSQGRIDPATADAIGQIIGAMGGGGPQVSDPAYQGTDWRSQEAPPNLPTPPPPGTSNATLPPNPAYLPPPIQGSGTHYPGINNTFTERVDTYNPPPDMTWTPPSETPSPVSPMPVGGYGASNTQARYAREQDRQQKRSSVSGGTDWRGQELSLLGMPADSVFQSTPSANLGLYTKNPGLAAYRMTGGSEAGASQMGPYVATALALARQGTLTGQGRDLTPMGPSSNVDQLRLAEQMVSGMQPGTQVDPQGIFVDAFKRARRTDPNLMNTGQGAGGDEANQIAVTGGALMNAATWMTDESAKGLQNRINAAAAAWMDMRAQGSQVSFPEYLKSIGARRWVAPGLAP